MLPEIRRKDHNKNMIFSGEKGQVNCRPTGKGKTARLAIGKLKEP